MMKTFFIHDLVDPKTGNTYKADNLATQHNIPVGTLVEIVPTGDKLSDETSPIGIRLHVCRHERDCDGTPLYRLGIIGETVMHGDKIYNSFGGYPEISLRVVHA